MRKSTVSLLIAGFWLGLTGVSGAQVAEKPFSAADLKLACADSNSQICAAYMAGYSQGYYYSTVSSQTGYTPCLTQPLTEPKVRTIATSFMEQHPEVLGQGAASVVAEALVSAYPCANLR